PLLLNPRNTLMRWCLLVLMLCSSFALAQPCAPFWLRGDGIPGINGSVHAMTRWDPDGPGPQAARLVVGGQFTIAGTAQVSNIAQWDGAQWSPLGPGTNGDVRALAASPTGDLFAGGVFTSAGGNPASHIARWNGSTWSTLSTGVNGNVFCLQA